MGDNEEISRGKLLLNVTDDVILVDLKIYERKH